jgi:hypothetical protein
MGEELIPRRLGEGDVGGASAVAIAEKFGSAPAGGEDVGEEDEHRPHVDLTK